MPKMGKQIEVKDVYREITGWTVTDGHKKNLQSSETNTQIWLQAFKRNLLFLSLSNAL